MNDKQIAAVSDLLGQLKEWQNVSVVQEDVNLRVKGDKDGHHYEYVVPEDGEWYGPVNLN